MSEEKTIYEQFNAAFPHMRVAIVMRKESLVGKVVIKGKTAYCHFLGTRMVRATVTGGGYDLATAACAKAAQKAFDQALAEDRIMEGWEREFWAALIKDDGLHWDRQLQDTNFQVYFAI